MDKLDRKILGLYQHDTRSMEDYASFARRCFKSDKSVARFDTHIVLDRVKTGLSILVPSE
jgi:hypothetical protein